MRKSSVSYMKLFIGFFSVLSLVVSPPLWSDAKKTPAPEETPASLYEDLELFSRVLHQVRQDYVEKVDDQTLIYGAIQGMLSTLDPHSQFMPPEAYKELRADTEGKFGGVGLEITSKDNQLVVVTPIEGSPAYRAGIKEGDRIVKIDGLSAKEIGINEASQKLRGHSGTHVTLVLIRNGMRDPLEINLMREIIHIKSVRSEMLDPGFGYVRVSSFKQGTTGELEKALNLLNKESKGGLKGLILDLRNNPGGLLDESVDIANLFLESGVIVSTVSRNHEIDKKMATREGSEPTYPIILLVNGGSASAAEILAGALQDHKRAVVLGTQTFGKGSVQIISDVGEGAALKLTIAKYYTPKGRSIQALGITPDIIVEQSKGSGEKFLREKDLKNHLASEKEVPQKSSNKVALAKNSPEVGEDFQKKTALDYLKSWEVFHKK